MSNKITSCKACGESIVYLRTQRGSNMPVDAGTVHPSDTMFDRERHSSHFDTCPHADDFRKKDERKDSLFDAAASDREADLLVGETIVGTPAGEKRHVRSRHSLTMTRCGQYISGYSRINPTDEKIPVCKECLGSLFNEKVTKPKIFA
jgi:hypothetical protein